MGVGGQLHAQADLPLYPLYTRLGRPQGRSGRVLKISPPPGFDPRTVQLVASRYTDSAIPAHNSVVFRHYENTKKFYLLPWVQCNYHCTDFYEARSCLTTSTQINREIWNLRAEIHLRP
jgi:hypothetical protein